MSLFRTILIATFICLSLINAEETPTTKTDLTEQTIENMSVKELRKFLKNRNLECIGCIEKSHFIKMAKEHMDTPVRIQGEKDQVKAEDVQFESQEVPDFKGMHINDILSKFKGSEEDKRKVIEELRKNGIPVDESNILLTF
eukprot:TRINITY_DN2868_c0_g1_i1.p1 TRINITY_DN2868_c0_g1~~TRINITY_DN2868_c0_g1_i1.p1  ORF type:complete len:142 (+),score=39.95 TRINITY_DN2868_c0_g1_i1:3-428(+)